MEHPQPFSFAYRVHVGVFLWMVLIGKLAVRRRQPTEGERRRTAPTPQGAGGEHRHAGRIQAAAQVNADRAGAVQAVFHRPGMDRQELLRVGVVRRAPHPRRPLGPPVPLGRRPDARRCTAPLDGEDVAGRQLAYRREERTGRGGHGVLRQMRRHDRLVQRVGDPGRRENRFHGAGEDEPPSRRGIVERPHTDRVPDTEEPAPPGVPYREGVVAEQAVGAGPAPALPGPEDQIGVGETGALRRGDAQRAAERIAIVETGVRGDGQSRFPVDAQRGCGRGRPGRDAGARRSGGELPAGRRVPAAEAGRPFRPARTGRSVAGGEPRQHRRQRRRDVRAVSDAAGNCGHHRLLPAGAVDFPEGVSGGAAGATDSLASAGRAARRCARARTST